MDVTVCVCTFGDPSWIELAVRHALPSVTASKVKVVHGATLAQARNEAAFFADSEWLIYLDADDRLGEGYIEAMAEASGDLRAPRLFIGDVEMPLVDRDIEQQNPCCVGTAIRRELLLDCGGWPEFRAWEDWALFLRAVRRGAVIEHTQAVYLAAPSPYGRNSTVTDPSGLHREIRAWA